MPNRVPLPDCPAGENPFVWIFRTAPKVRAARRAIAEREQEDRAHERKEANRPARRR